MNPTADARDRALTLLTASVTKARRKTQVPFPKEFLRSSDDAPPLAQLVQGGRGGEVRLKLYLTITMMATRAPHDLKQPPSPRRWAELLAVTGESPARRVSDGLRWLRDHQLIALTPRAGTLPLITLLDPAGTGEPYVRPLAKGSLYVSLPLGLWTQGWIIELPATSLALMMVILDIQQNRDQFRYTYQQERAAYGLSTDTWTRARKDLERSGLLEVKRIPQGGDFDFQWMRNLYRIDKERLSTPPDPR